jgi:xanthine dehydrogenase YagT iron-sulfur-binding subunit
VLAFAREWAPAHDRERDAALRAQLRGLGAVMIIAADAGLWWFRPDDDVERLAAPGPALAAELAALAGRYEVAAAHDAVFVVDGAGIVRFTHQRADSLADALADALDTAGRERSRGALRHDPSRREWAVMCLVAGFGLALLPSCRRRRSPPPAPEVAATPAIPGHDDLDIVLDVNGRERPLRIDARVSLLDALRERLGLTGTKKGCDHGQCGACTVHVDGRAVDACLTLAVAAQGQKILTIEGLAAGDTLHPVQQAFVAHDGFQCGYCTPGQIMTAVALLADGHAVTDDEVRAQMSGNLCRCGAYPNIVAAIQSARRAGAPT